MKVFHPKFRIPRNVFSGTRQSQAAEMTIAPGGKEGGPENRHDGDQWLFVVSGSGVAVFGKKSRALVEHSLLQIKAGEKHEVRNTGRAPLRTLNFYAPPVYKRGR